jgi:hypothetical protein
MHKETQASFPREPSNGHAWKKSLCEILELEAAVTTESLLEMQILEPPQIYLTQKPGMGLSNIVLKGPSRRYDTY